MYIEPEVPEMKSFSKRIYILWIEIQTILAETKPNADVPTYIIITFNSRGLALCSMLLYTAMETLHWKKGVFHEKQNILGQIVGKILVMVFSILWTIKQDKCENV